MKNNVLHESAASAPLYQYGVRSLGTSLTRELDARASKRPNDRARSRATEETTERERETRRRGRSGPRSLSEPALASLAWLLARCGPERPRRLVSRSRSVVSSVARLLARSLGLFLARASSSLARSPPSSLTPRPCSDGIIFLNGIINMHLQ